MIKEEINKETLNFYIHNDHAIGVSTSDSCFSKDQVKGSYDERYSILKHLLGVTGDGLDHVGIVAKVETEVVNGENVSYVYTIEGNVDSKVIMRKVPLTNATYSDSYLTTIGSNEVFNIFGYATLNWNEAYK